MSFSAFEYSLLSVFLYLVYFSRQMHCGANLEAHLYLPCREAIFRHAEAASYGVAPCSVESERSVLVVVFFGVFEGVRSILNVFIWRFLNASH
jgi:hypothetical protein